MSWFLEGLESFLFDNNQTKDGQAYGFLPLIGPALPVLLIEISYAIFVLKIGPKYMESRKPFDLKTVLKYYNIAQIILNAYISVLAVDNILAEPDIEVSCMMQLPIGHSRKNIEVHLFYLGYLTKFLDYFDTICFVLRKSYRQVNFLHVYHHLMMTTCAYVYIRYHGFGGHSAIVGVLNSIVHAFMYSYYLLSTTRPSMKQSSWKRYITKLQLVQFCLMLIHQAWPIIFRPDCEFPKKWLILSMVQAGLMLIMFSNFYRKTYMSSGSKRAEKKLEKSVINSNENIDSTKKLD